MSLSSSTRERFLLKVAGYLRTVAAAKAAKSRALEIAAGGTSFLSSLCPPCAAGSSSVAAPPAPTSPLAEGNQTEMTQGSSLGIDRK